VYLRKHILRYATEEFLHRHRHHFELVKNRRGHIKRAICKASLSFDARPDSVLGLAFEQHLQHGVCYALQGVTGSH